VTVNLLLELTLRGSLAALVVIAFDRSLAGRVSGASRRWWWCLVPLAFLVPLRIPILPVLDRLPAVAVVWSRAPMEIPALAAAAKTGGGHAMLGLVFWMAGAITYIALVAIQTVRASRRWSRERLSTNHALLELLEDCKTETGVTAPIGLVVSNSVPSPAILGWLRPRILLPASLAASGPTEELRPILLHELAHFRWFDVPFNWLLTLVRAVHWFNPLAHFGAIAWARFREEAADEAAVKWMRDDSGQAYGDALVRALRQTRGAAAPFGAMAIVESVQQLKRRIKMINRYRYKSPRVLLAGIVSLLLAAMIFSGPSRAADGAPSDPKAAAIASMQPWLNEIDAGQYDQSWKDASTLFKSHVSDETWVGDMDRVRTPLGKCDVRRQVSAILEKDVPTPKGVVKGEFVVAQFESSFENMKHTVETVSFYKEEDGTWKAAGYLIQP
jgi:beta-lactamase regulating signal transducer with metallopeptidase domain